MKASLVERAGEEHESLIASFEPCDTAESRWLKGFSDEIAVLSPDWLTQEIRQELLQAAAQYDE